VLVSYLKVLPSTHVVVGLQYYYILLQSPTTSTLCGPSSGRNVVTRTTYEMRVLIKFVSCINLKIYN